MADEALRRLWEAVRRDFDRAQSLLPSPPVEHQGSVIRLKECLEHNELELALDVLVSIGEDNQAPPEYWQTLVSAAERMGLDWHKAQLSER